TLTDETAERLVRLGAEITGLLGGALDIEWALDGDEIWIVQARPITAVPPAPGGTDDAGTPRQGGAGASSGRATGPARVVRGPGDFPRVRAGDIIICPTTDPSWTPLLQIAAGVVTEHGGMLAHAAIVARE